MASYKSVNPFTGEEYKTYPLHGSNDISDALSAAQELSPFALNFNLEARLQGVSRLSKLLRDDQEFLADAISREMGKVLSEAKAEIEKCAWLCDYYRENATAYLAAEEIDLGEDKAIKTFEPLGIVLGIMPWNFPFWQVFRFAVPALLAGNRVLLKHAPNCPHSAELLENLFQNCFPQGAFKNLRLSNEQAAELLAREEVKALSLTGSTQAGSTVAQIAAKHLKPQLLELGGSNAFIIFKDAEIKAAAELAGRARLMNAGQSCIAAKRFIVHESLIEDFSKELIKVFKSYQLGDPRLSQTEIGPLARRDLAEKVQEQINKALNQGADLLLGGKRRDNFIEPTIIRISNKANPILQEEVFGPVASLISFNNIEEAIAISNESPFGLGVSLIGKNSSELLKWAPYFEEGAVFINELVKSDPRLPFGGVKSSGYGRELGPEGIRSFTNLKTIYIKESL